MSMRRRSRSSVRNAPSRVLFLILIGNTVSELEGKDINELIAEGSQKLASVPSGGGAAAGGAAAGGAAAGGAAAPAEEEKKEEKEEEKEESDEDMGFGLFD